MHAFSPGTQPDRPDLESVRLAQVFDRSPLGKRSCKTQQRETEWDFIFALDDLIVRGTIDLWFEDASGMTLVDYKTDEVAAEQASVRAGDYALQLAVYALALERALGKPPKQAWLHFLKPDTTIQIPLRDAAADIRGVIRDYIEAQQRQDFPLHVGSHCRRCEFFRSICPAKLAVTE